MMIFSFLFPVPVFNTHVMAHCFAREAFLLIVLLVLVQDSFCCTCLRRPNEEKFCTANIGMFTFFVKRTSILAHSG